MNRVLLLFEDDDNEGVCVEDDDDDDDENILETLKFGGNELNLGSGERGVIGGTEFSKTAIFGIGLW